MDLMEIAIKSNQSKYHIIHAIKAPTLKSIRRIKRIIVTLIFNVSKKKSYAGMNELPHARNKYTMELPFLRVIKKFVKI